VSNPGDVILIGASGWIGHSVKERLPVARCISARDLLRRELDSLRKAVSGDARPTIVNLATVKSGPREQMAAVNHSLVAQLAKFTTEFGGRLVQMGSAAEYGLAPGAEWVSQETRCKPTSDYGITKFAGSTSALECEGGIVLRPLNVYDRPPQEGSPLADIRGRILAGVRSHQDVEVLSAGTRRDYVSRSFVAASIEWAVRNPAARGAFSVSSGYAVGVGEIAATTINLMGSDVQVADLQVFPPTTIAADPQPWGDVSGLWERSGAPQIAAALVEI